jgi:poly-beta-1,6-N-acetyl-D-glucosamine synthase
MGQIVHLLWRTHHKIACTKPKAGEVVAFRKVIKGIDPKTPVDEAYIEYELKKLGYKLAYAPNAIIFNRGPETREDFLKQRERIFRGHLALNQLGYQVPTLSTVNVLKASLMVYMNMNVNDLIKGALLEHQARQKGKKSFKANGHDGTWDMCNTTKDLVKFN